MDEASLPTSKTSLFNCALVHPPRFTYRRSWLLRLPSVTQISSSFLFPLVTLISVQTHCTVSHPTGSSRTPHSRLPWLRTPSSSYHSIISSFSLQQNPWVIYTHVPQFCASDSLRNLLQAGVHTPHSTETTFQDLQPFPSSQSQRSSLSSHLTQSLRHSLSELMTSPLEIFSSLGRLEPTFSWLDSCPPISQSPPSWLWILKAVQLPQPFSQSILIHSLGHPI